MVIEINSGFLFGGTDCKGPEGRLQGADNLPNTDLEGGRKPGPGYVGFMHFTVWML